MYLHEMFTSYQAYPNTFTPTDDIHHLPVSSLNFKNYRIIYNIINIQ